ncbi:hypothetical protein BLOT_004189 [Blomia tropicalis]|nr:hypothetical protein BLOT_004189 [Blomia tropicalis]
MCGNKILKYQLWIPIHKYTSKLVSHNSDLCISVCSNFIFMFFVVNEFLLSQLSNLYSKI